MNMSHCRFSNTAIALEDCEAALDDMIQDGGRLSEEEEGEAARLFDIMINMFGHVSGGTGSDQLTNAVKSLNRCRGEIEEAVQKIACGEAF